MTNNCSLHLGRNGPEWKTRDDMVREYNANLRKAQFSGLTRDARKQAFNELRAARFYAARDTSHYSEDISQDRDAARRRRRLSVSRDMLQGPARVRNVFDVGGGKSFPAMHRRASVGCNADTMRFEREADVLRMRRIVDEKDLPDWNSDESISAFFAKVHAKVLDGFKGSNNGLNRVLDAAPGIFLFTELLKRSEVLIEEDLTEMYARSIFPIRNLNTWLPQWSYERIDDRGVLPQTMDPTYLPSGAPRGSENRAPVLRPLAFFHHAASWSNIELLQYAEAVANGAADVRLDQRRINTAIRMMNMREDLFAFFGDDDLDLHGLFSPEDKTQIQRIPAGTKFGAGANAEDDRQLLTRDVKVILESTERILAPNTLMLSTNTWLYVNDTRYGDVSADSNQTVLEAAMATLEKLGIEDVIWVPEVGYRAAQEARLQDHGVPAAEATRLAGGVGDGNQDMVVMRRDPTVAELVVAKDRVMYPARETVNDRVEARMLQGTGAMVFYKPEAIRIVTDVGPA